MTKVEKEYESKYGDIPISQDARVSVLINRLNRKSDASKSLIFDEIRRLEQLKWKTYECTIYVLPKATPRPRYNGNMNFFYVSGAKNNKKYFKKFLKDHPHELITSPMKFDINIYLPTPKSMSNKEKVLAELGYIRPISKPDFDNLAKTYTDMMKDSLIYDDALIIDGRIKKYYSIKPRIEIKIEYMEEIDSLFNKRKIDSYLNKIKESEITKNE